MWPVLDISAATTDAAAGIASGAFADTYNLADGGTKHLYAVWKVAD